MPNAAIVRVFNARGDVVGYGVKADSGHVLVASSVVRTALGVKFTRLAGAPAESVITVDLPFGKERRQYSARIVRWDPPRDSGPRDRITTLALDETSSDSTFLDATREFEGEVPVSLVAFKADGTGQHEIEGVVNAAEGHTWWVLSLPSVKEASNPRLAGAPLWDGGGNLVGLTLGQIPGSHRRYVARVRYLLSREVPAESPAGSARWELHNVMNVAPLRLVADLKKLEAEGLDPHECDQVKEALKELTKELAALEANVPFDRPPSRRAQALHDVYDRWNGGDKGEPGRAHRKTFLAGVDDSAHALGRARRDFSESLYDSQVAEGARRVMGRFATLPAIVNENGHTRFPEIKKLLALYRGRR